MKYKTEDSIIYGKGKHSDRQLSFFADPEVLLNDYKEYEKFIKGCEHCVRSDDRYIDYLAEAHEAGLNQCAILGDISKGGKKVKLELHHGPIFNLFDYCDIVTKYHLIHKDKDITTFDIGDEVLSCHEKNWVMFVMLSKSAHKAAHTNIFIDIKATIGRVDKFINHYLDGLEMEHFEMLERYIEESKKTEGTMDNGLFETGERLSRFK